MINIQHFSFSRLTNGNASQVYGRLEVILREIDPSYGEDTPAEDLFNSIILPKRDFFIEKNTLFSESVRQSVASAITRDLKNREAERDRITNMSSRTITNGMKSSNAEIVHAANRIDVAWRLYGHITQRQQDEQTRITEKLLRDLATEEMQGFTERIPGLQSLLDGLKQINDEFAVLFNERVDERGNITLGLTADLRTQVDTAIAELMELLRAVQLLYNLPRMTEPIHAINNILDQARLDLSARRRGINARNQHHNTDENPDDDGEDENYPDKEE